MNSSLINAAVSMHGLQQKLDTISNNIANVGTDGFKKKDVTFFDILTTTKQQQKEFQFPGRLTPAGMNQGWGSKISQVQINFAQGILRITNNPLDAAIEGNGLFEVGLSELDEAGNTVYKRAWTRNGSFQLSVNPADTNSLYLVTPDGDRVMGTDNNPIQVPRDHRILIDISGNIEAVSELDPFAEPIAVGQLKVVGVLQPQQLQNIGNNLFELSDEVLAANIEDQILADFETYNSVSSTPIKVHQAFLEQSNVELASEMAELLTVQRAYQLSSRAVTSSDTMMNLANNLRG